MYAAERARRALRERDALRRGGARRQRPRRHRRGHFAEAVVALWFGNKGRLDVVGRSGPQRSANVQLAQLCTPVQRNDDGEQQKRHFH